jgi:hypothetical protein
MKQVLIRSILFSALLATVACAPDGPAPQYATDDGNADLVEVSPGVEVIADYDEPIFFADDVYWVNRGGYWYSSGWYGGGWTRAERVPGHISGIGHPDAYVHYRPQGFVAHAQIRGYANHAQYHAAHAASGGVHVRAAVRGGRRH